MDRSQHSDIFSFDEGSQDAHLTLTPSQQEVSSTYTPYVETERVKVIWGTSVNVHQTAEKFKEFIRGSLAYLSELENMSLTQKFVMKLDCSTLDPTLCSELVNYPQEVIPIFQNALREIYMERYVENVPEIKIRPFNVGRPTSVRSINPKDIDKLVNGTGMVVRSSGVIPEMKRAKYKCIQCTREVLVDSIKGMVNEPVKCDCGGRYTFELKHNESVYSDKQIVRLQELPECIPEGTTPMTITVVSKDDLIDELIPGDKVRVTGILKAVPVRINPALKKVKSTFRCYIELLSTAKLTSSEAKENESSKEPENNGGLDNAFVEEINRLKLRKDVYSLLSRSIAPSVFGMEDVKKALLLQLAGGVSKDLGSSRLRGDVNILLAGDPGVSKSQLLGFVHRLSDRGVYTSGKGSSAVGLTASVSKDVDSGQFILESGALVLSDGGVCCIDEFDKMNESTRSVLHEVMEQQTVSIAKAGIITTLNARCSILASCNPIESKYNLKKSIIDNLSLPSTLLSRFDVICLLIDKADESHDKSVADHILGMYMENGPNSTDRLVNSRVTGTEEHVSIEVLKAYLKEAKAIVPALTEDGIEALKTSYVELRQLDNGNSVTATTRQLESLIRLSEAHARIRMSHVVEKEDVKEAIRIIKESLLIYALDPRTGRIDVDMIITGKSASKTKLLEDLKSAILRVLRKKTAVSELLELTNSDEKLLKEALEDLEMEDLVYYDRSSSTVEKLR